MRKVEKCSQLRNKSLQSRIKNEGIQGDDRCRVQDTEGCRWEDTKPGEGWKTTEFRVKELKTVEHYLWRLWGVPGYVSLQRDT